MKEEIVIAAVREADSAAVAQLYFDAGFLPPVSDISFIPAMITGSFVWVGAWCNGELIGMGRAISDGISDAYIQDVVVKANYRRQGIGAGIIREIIAILRQHGVDWIALVGVPGTKHFYQELGFEELSEYLPMQWKGF